MHAADGDRGLTRSAVVLVAALLAVGVALRAWAQQGDVALLDGDEAVVGLQALRIAGGSQETFFLGQPYGGTLEATLASVPLRLFGAEAWALRLAPAACTLVAGLLLCLLGRRVHERRPAGWVAGAVLVSWPPVYVWFGMHALGFYASSLALGVATCLLLTVLADDQRYRWYGALGLVAGLAWWQAPYVAYFAVPGVAWLALHRRWQAIVRLPLALPTAAIGALPWLTANVGDGFPSLDQELYASGGSYLGKLWYVAHTGLAIATGFEAPYTGEAPGGPAARVAYVAVAVGLGVATLVGLRHRRLWALGLLAFPLLYALNPLPPTTAHGRYFFFLAPWLALLAGDVAARSRRWLLATAVVIGATTVLGLIGMHRVPWEVAYRQSTDPVAAALEARDVEHAFAEYFTAYKLVFESGEEVLATPYTGVRDQALDHMVRAAERVAYVFPTTEPGVADDLALFDNLGIPTERIEVEGFVVVIPARRVLPEELGAALLVP